jgi:HTH-type transcriptional regulator / antitoxin HigA
MNDSVKSPGDLIKGLLTERGWTQEDLASIMNLSRQSVNALISGRTALTPETAKRLSLAFDNSFDMWWMAEGRYRESLLDNPHIVDGKRLEHMQKRGWLSPDKSADELEPELKEYFETDNLESDFELPMAFKRTVKQLKLNRSELAWAYRVKHLASMLPAAPYDDRRMDDLLKTLRPLAAKSKAVHRIPDVLSGYGIRFVIVEPLPRAKIDGAAFWLNEKSPVIALTARYDNIGSFWFALIHECIHIKYRDRFSLDSDMEGSIDSQVDEEELRANREAAEILVPQKALNQFMNRWRPYYSTARINNFATQLGIHPGIIVGQLQHRKEIGYNTHRDLLAKVRELVTLTAFTDGWGRPTPQIRKVG